MDSKHRLDAPDNDSLRNIEQVGDRSELASLYPNAHNEWEGTNLLSQQAREEKRANEQLQISLTLRRWFAVIGVLTPLPLILGALLFTVAYTYLRIENLAYLILPVVITVALWGYASYRATKRVHDIFYQHSIVATPFMAALLLMLATSIPALYLALRELYGTSLIYNAVITCLVILAASIAYSGMLVFIWTAQKVSGAYKIGLVGILVGVIGLVTLLVNSL